ELFEKIERRDAAEILPERLPDPIAFESQRDFVREVLENEVHLRAVGPNFVPADQEPPDGASRRYRDHMNSQGSPSELVTAGYRWAPGTELSASALNGNGNGARKRRPAQHERRP